MLGCTQLKPSPVAVGLLAGRRERWGQGRSWVLQVERRLVEAVWMWHSSLCIHRRFLGLSQRRVMVDRGGRRGHVLRTPTDHDPPYQVGHASCVYPVR